MVSKVYFRVERVKFFVSLSCCCCFLLLFLFVCLFGFVFQLNEKSLNLRSGCTKLVVEPNEGNLLEGLEISYV